MSCRSTSGNPVWCGTLRGRGVPALRRENNEQDPLFLAWVGCICMGRVVTVCPIHPGFPSPPGRFKLLEPRHASRVCRRAGGGKPEGDRIPPTRGGSSLATCPAVPYLRPLPPQAAAAPRPPPAHAHTPRAPRAPAAGLPPLSPRDRNAHAHAPPHAFRSLAAVGGWYVGGKLRWQPTILCRHI